jgi:dynein heavy chain, axonemal
LFDCIDNSIKARNLTKTDYFVMKVIQLYEMILVRHGLMVVGNPFGAKTSITKVLADALS